MQDAGAFRISADHPCLAGHFPGRPIVPGVVLLDEAFALIRAALGCGPPDRIAQVKFLAPVLPGQTVALSLDVGATGSLAFTGRVDDAVVMRGTATLPSSGDLS